MTQQEIFDHLATKGFRQEGDWMYLRRGDDYLRMSYPLGTLIYNSTKDLPLSSGKNAGVYFPKSFENLRDIVAMIICYYEREF